MSVFPMRFEAASVLGKEEVKHLEELNKEYYR